MSLKVSLLINQLIILISFRSCSSLHSLGDLFGDFKVKIVSTYISLHPSTSFIYLLFKYSRKTMVPISSQFRLMVPKWFQNLGFILI
jgi:hypothetical protein